MELKGASLAWAPKDKSSKKNVLEVSGGVGEKEKGLTDGLGPSLSKPQAGGPGELGLEFSGLKTKTASTLGIHPQRFRHHRFCSSLSRSGVHWSPWS